MRFSSLLAGAASLVLVSAATVANRYSPIPGYPNGNGYCLTDAQANFLAKTFSSILSVTNRTQAGVIASTLLNNNYTETSDSINTLAHQPLGSSSFDGKAGFIDGVTHQPPVGSVTTLDVFHDCTKISWRWLINGLGLSKYPVRGINDLTANPLTGQISANNLEFNSIAWGIDTGYKCQFPDGTEI